MRATKLGRPLRAAWAANWPLTLAGLAMLLVLGAALIGLLLDPQVITGQPAWLKPAKFAVSIAVYSFTFIWMLSFVRGPWRRRAGRAASVTAVCSVVEVVIIAGQALRGVPSHFNVATPLDAALLSAMAASIVVVWLMSLVLAAALLAQRIDDAAMAWGLRLGVLIGLVGAGLAFTMTLPTPAQSAAMDRGAPLSIVGAHAVGAPDDGPGLPLLGWSTSGGDLRVAHFIGLHAMQALPLFGWLAGRRRDLAPRRRAALVIIAGLGYLGLVLLTFWQALRGQPLTGPDELTLTALTGLCVAVAVAAVATLRLAWGSGRLAEGPAPRVQ